MKKKFEINIAHLVSVPLTIWLAYTGRIDWWILLAVWLPTFEFSISRKS